MVKHLEDNEFISTSQHGFVSKRSSLTNLLETPEEWTEALDEGYGIMQYSWTIKRPLMLCHTGDC